MNVTKTIFELIESSHQIEVKEIGVQQSKEGTTYINEEDFFRNSSVDYFRTSSFSGVRNSEIESSSEEGDNNQPKMTSKFSFQSKDFEIISSLGNGAYGDVFKAKHKITGEIYSIKVIDKKMIEKENKGYQIFVENEMLNYCNHPNIIKIFGCYEDKESFYLVEEYYQKGDLAEFLNQNSILTKEEIQFIVGQIVLCLEYLSTLHIIHRDIKPENFMIDKTFNLKLVDFGTATFKGKVLDEETYKFIEEEKFLNAFPSSESFNVESSVEKKKPKTCKSTQNVQELEKVFQPDRLNSSMILGKCSITKDLVSPFTKSGNFKHYEIVKKQKFVGTAEYMSPEIINNQQIGEFTDIWSLMCIIFQIFTGQSPFRDKTEYLIFQNILQFKYNTEKIAQIPKDAYDLIFSILKLNPSQRMGYDKEKGYDFKKLKEHPFFVIQPSLKIEEVIKNLIKKSNYVISKKKENKENIAKAQCIFEVDNSIKTNSQNSLSEYSKSNKSSIYQDPHGDKVLKSGTLKKRSPYFYYDLRKVILISTPRIDYIDPETKEVKGTIPLDKSCNAELVKNNQFFLNTPKRTYSFMCKEKYDITPWVTAINNAISTYAK